MAIDLLIQRRNQPMETGRVVPIATHDVFQRYWLPAVQALGLKFVPLFETGFPVSPDDLPDVLAELDTLSKWLEPHAHDEAKPILLRLQTLISELKALKDNNDTTLYIG